MKKVKIMLTATVVMAVVGGAFAFKSAKSFGNQFCTTLQGSACLRDVDNVLVKYRVTTTTTPGQFTIGYCVPTTVGTNPDCSTIESTKKITVDQ
jgi:hypothetical protein